MVNPVNDPPKWIFTFGPPTKESLISSATRMRDESVPHLPPRRRLPGFPRPGVELRSPRLRVPTSLPLIPGLGSTATLVILAAFCIGGCYTFCALRTKTDDPYDYEAALEQVVQEQIPGD